MKHYCIAAGLFTLTVVAAPSPARAEEPARALYEQASKLMEEGKFTQACPLFEKSLALHANVNAQYFLADCYEKIGKTASAWRNFAGAESKAKALGKEDKAEAAHTRAEALAPKLSRLTITVAARAPGLVVERDGVAVEEAQWGLAIPVDPGPIHITASAPGKRGWTHDLTMAPDAAKVIVVVPALADALVKPASPASTPVTSPSPLPSDRSAMGGQKLVALGAAGLGVVGLAVGGIIAFSAKSHYAESDAYCHGDVCASKGLTIREEAMHRGNVATIVLGVGAAVAIGGAVLWFTAPKTEAVRVGVNGNGFVVGGRF